MGKSCYQLCFLIEKKYNMQTHVESVYIFCYFALNNNLALMHAWFITRDNGTIQCKHKGNYVTLYKEQF